jgi:hypothetical protein
VKSVKSSDGWVLNIYPPHHLLEAHSDGQDEKKFSSLKLARDLGFASVGQFERGRDISEEKHFHFLLEYDMK